MDNIKKEDKQYGLIIPKKQLSVPKAINVFGDEDASDEEDGTDWVRKALKAEGEKNKIKKQTKLSMQKALKEDPTIYQYDEVYDDIEGARNQVKTIKIQEKKPKYIQNLLRAAERRKKEQEHRIERMVQKEREAEGTMYADKESFVTSAYRAKLEEFKQMEEEEARMSRLESIGDVTKQQDMSGFYRHLYKQTVENVEEVSEEKEKSNIEVKDITNHESAFVKDEKDEEKEISSNKSIISAKSKKSRQYRQRVIETYESDSDLETKAEPCNKSIITHDTEDKNNSASEVKEPDKKKQKCEVQDTLSSSKPLDENADNNKDSENKLQNVIDKEVQSKEEREHKENKENQENQENQSEIIQKKERSSIWLKRTVGPVFDAALQRYYARKAARNAGIQ